MALVDGVHEQDLDDETKNSTFSMMTMRVWNLYRAMKVNGSCVSLRGCCSLHANRAHHGGMPFFVLDAPLN